MAKTTIYGQRKRSLRKVLNVKSARSISLTSVRVKVINNSNWNLAKDWFWRQNARERPWLLSQREEQQRGAKWRMVLFDRGSLSRKLKSENDNCPLIYCLRLCKQLGDKWIPSWYTRRNTSFVSLAEHLPPRMESEEEEEDVRGVGHLETGRTTVRVREGRGVVSSTQPLCHRGRAARRWRAIARILFPNSFYDNDDRRGIVKKSGRCFLRWSRSATSCLLVLLLLPYLASARPGSDATAASGGN